MAGIAAIIKRREVTSERGRLPRGRVNQRLPEQFAQSPLFDPVRWGNFAAYGKPPAHAMSQQVFNFTSDRESLTHYRDGFMEPTFAPSPHAGMPRGRQTPFPTRVNIARNPAAAYGSIVMLQAGY